LCNDGICCYYWWPTEAEAQAAADAINQYGSYWLGQHGYGNDRLSINDIDDIDPDMWETYKLFNAIYYECPICGEEHRDSEGARWCCQERPKRLITLPKYAALHNVTPRAVRGKIARGSIKALKIGRDWVLAADEPCTDRRYKAEKLKEVKNE